MQGAGAAPRGGGWGGGRARAGARGGGGGGGGRPSHPPNFTLLGKNDRKGGEKKDGKVKVTISPTPYVWVLPPHVGVWRRAWQGESIKVYVLI